MTDVAGTWQLRIDSLLDQIMTASPSSADYAALVAGAGTRVAHALHLPEWTVQDHLKSVFAKLNVHSRREALARLAGT